MVSLARQKREQFHTFAPTQDKITVLSAKAAPNDVFLLSLTCIFADRPVCLEVPENQIL